MNKKRRSLQKVMATVMLVGSGACTALYAQNDFADVIFQGGSAIPMNPTSGVNIMG